MLNNLGEALGATRDSEGIGCLERSLTIRHEIGDRTGEAQSANNLADAYPGSAGRLRLSSLFGRARDLNRDVGNRYGEGVAQTNLGAALLDLGRAEEAVDSPGAGPPHLRRDPLPATAWATPVPPGPLLPVAGPGRRKPWTACSRP